MDNRVFNVNGSGEEMLLKTLELAFMQESKSTTCESWKQTKEHGLILYWLKGASEDRIQMPGKLNVKQCLPVVMAWLDSEFAKTVDYNEGCGPTVDVTMSDGWQVYCEAWGHVGGDWATICAIKPAFMWHGK